MSNEAMGMEGMKNESFSEIRLHRMSRCNHKRSKTLNNVKILLVHEYHPICFHAFNFFDYALFFDSNLVFIHR